MNKKTNVSPYRIELPPLFAAWPTEQKREYIRRKTPAFILAFEARILRRLAKSPFVGVRYANPIDLEETRLKGHKLFKHSRFTVQATEYGHKAKVIEGHANGTIQRRENPNKINLSPVLSYNVNTGNFSIGFGTVNNPKSKPTNVYILDGLRVPKVAIEDCLPQKKASKPSNWITLNPDKLLAIR